jgi:hypothetical protein
MKKALWMTLGLFAVVILAACQPSNTVVDTADDDDGTDVVRYERDPAAPDTDINVYDDNDPDNVYVDDNPDTVYVDDGEPSTTNNYYQNTYENNGADSTDDTGMTDDTTTGTTATQ